MSAALSRLIRALPREEHPCKTPSLSEAIFPRSGTEEPFAVLKLVTVTLQGQLSQLWRAVTYEKSRHLIEGG
jgi:hypothetical protein